MGIELETVDGLVQDCRNTIIDVLGYGTIGFEKKQGNTHSREIYWLNSSNVSRASTADIDYHVVPFLILETVGITYWLAVSIQFDLYKGLHKFHDTSLLVFEGTYNDEKKTPILRAEWGISEDGLHAQPHWHIYPSYLNVVIAPFVVSAASEKTDFVPEQAVKKDGYYKDVGEEDITKFHFAMSSLWHHDGQGAHVVEASTTGLVNWISGCLEYIKVQLQHMVK